MQQSNKTSGSVNKHNKHNKYRASHTATCGHARTSFKKKFSSYKKYPLGGQIPPRNFESCVRHVATQLFLPCLANHATTRLAMTPNPLLTTSLPPSQQKKKEEGHASADAGNVCLWT